MKCTINKTKIIFFIFQDDHEICFVDDEGFRKLSVPDYPSEKILDRFIAKEEAAKPDEIQKKAA